MTRCRLESLVFVAVAAAGIAWVALRAAPPHGERAVSDSRPRLDPARLSRIEYRHPPPCASPTEELYFFMDDVMVALPIGVSPWVAQVELLFHERLADGSFRPISLPRATIHRSGDGTSQYGFPVLIDERGVRLMCSASPPPRSFFPVLAPGAAHQISVELGEDDRVLYNGTHWAEFDVPGVPEGWVYTIDVVVNDHRLDANGNRLD